MNLQLSFLIIKVTHPCHLTRASDIMDIRAINIISGKNRVNFGLLEHPIENFRTVALFDLDFD